VPAQAETLTFPKSPHATQPRRLAYDPRYDIRYYDHLVDDGISPHEARLATADKISQDLLAHLTELRRLKFFSYAMRTDEQGVLVTDTLVPTPIRDMHTNFQGEWDPEDPTSNLWLEKLIPYFETAPVGSSAFTLSAKSPDQTHEYKYDYSYLFIKEKPDYISCYGLEIDTPPEAQAAILNRQLANRQGDSLPPNLNSPHDQLPPKLPPCPDYKQVRGTAIFYPPDYHSSFSQAYLDILSPIKHWQEYQQILASESSFTGFTENTLLCQLQEKERADRTAEVIARAIASNSPTSYIQSVLSNLQHDILKQYQPELLSQALRSTEQEVRLPCGVVELGGGTYSLGIPQLTLPEILDFEPQLSFDFAVFHECMQCPLCKHLGVMETPSQYICKNGCGTKADKARLSA
jgi:hypothetical protein